MKVLDKQDDSVLVNVRVNSELKKDSQQLFDSLGLNISTAINIFLRKSLEVGGIPFDVRHNIPNEETIKAIEDAREAIKNRKAQEGYSSSKDLLDVLNSKD